MKDSKNVIVVIDDNQSILDGIALLLENNGYIAYAFTNAKKTLDKLKQGDIVPDLIISDIIMPEMNGYDFFRSISNHTDLFQVPFIFLSAKKGVDDIRFGKMLGVDDYITKPFEPEDLLASVRGKLNRKKGISDLYETYLKHDLAQDKNLHGDRVHVIFVKWNDIQGPALEAYYPEDFQECISISEIGSQLFTASSLMFGNSFEIDPNGLLLPLVNIRKTAYIYFGSYPEPISRSRNVLYMVGTIAPRISYMHSLLLNQIFYDLSSKINRGETWDMVGLYEKVLQVIENELPPN